MKRPRNEQELEALLAEPPDYVAETLRDVPGDVLIVGAGGKMGATLATLARRALPDRAVHAASRFSDSNLRDRLERAGVRTWPVDALSAEALRELPEVDNVLYLVGRKFGTVGDPSSTWAANVVAPRRVADRYPRARLVVFSSGNVYPYREAARGGADESVSPAPVGEYAWSCLGRERVFEHAADATGQPVLLYRLNYAVELRYGVLVDVALAVHEGRPVDVSTGLLNVIWQGDANALALAALALAENPPAILNATGPETVSVRWLAEELGGLLGREPVLEGIESDTALLSSAARAHRLFGYPRVPLGELVEWTAAWIVEGGPLLGKPTHFDERGGSY